MGYVVDSTETSFRIRTPMLGVQLAKTSSLLAPAGTYSVQQRRKESIWRRTVGVGDDILIEEKGRWYLSKVRTHSPLECSSPSNLLGH